MPAMRQKLTDLARKNAKAVGKARKLADAREWVQLLSAPQNFSTTNTA
jgi:hypothetical protein